MGARSHSSPWVLGAVGGVLGPTLFFSGSAELHFHGRRVSLPHRAPQSPTQGPEARRRRRRSGGGAVGCSLPPALHPRSHLAPVTSSWSSRTAGAEVGADGGARGAGGHGVPGQGERPGSCVLGGQGAWCHGRILVPVTAAGPHGLTSSSACGGCAARGPVQLHGQPGAGSGCGWGWSLLSPRVLVGWRWERCFWVTLSRVRTGRGTVGTVTTAWPPRALVRGGGSAPQSSPSPHHRGRLTVAASCEPFGRAPCTQRCSAPFPSLPPSTPGSLLQASPANVPINPAPVIKPSRDTTDPGLLVPAWKINHPK